MRESSPAIEELYQRGDRERHTVTATISYKEVSEWLRSLLAQLRPSALGQAAARELGDLP